MGGVLWREGDAAHEEYKQQSWKHPLSAHRECHTSHSSQSLSGSVLDPRDQEEMFMDVIII